MSSTITTDVQGVTKPLPATVVTKKGGRIGSPKPWTEPVSREAQRFATAILEVLAGVRTPTNAAAALGIAVPRYYLYEQRALEGLVTACEPRPLSRASSSRRQLAALEKEVTRLKQECVRQQALVRAAQRTIGLAPSAPPKPVAKAESKVGNRGAGKKSRKRRPAVRALKAAAAIRAAPADDAEGPSGVLTAEVLQQSVVSNPMLATSSTLPATAARGG
jgi:hypothetical protein